MPIETSESFGQWLMRSDAGLLTRIVVGVALFAGVAIWDLARHGKQATRWHEYSFLLAVTLAGMVYGVINDVITSSISWEYFYYGKDLATELGPGIPPDITALHWEAAKIGLRAAGSAGAILAAIMLMANNPRRRPPRLSYPALIALLARILLLTIASSILLGLAGRAGWLNWISADFRLLASENLWRPSRFMLVYGVHLGGYAGGLIGVVWAVTRILRATETAKD